MAIVARSQITLVDISDSKSLQGFISTTVSRVQIDSNGTLSPDWSADMPVLKPNVYITGTLDDIIEKTEVEWFVNGKKIEEGDRRFTINQKSKTLRILDNLLSSSEPVLEFSFISRYKDRETGVEMVARDSVEFTRIESGKEGEGAQNLFLSFPDGSVFKNAAPGEEKRLFAEYYDGGTKVSSNMTKIKWFYMEPELKAGDDNYDPDGGEGWSLIGPDNNKENGLRDYTTLNLTVSNNAVEGTESFKVVIQYGDKVPMSSIATMIDITDPYQAVIEGNLSLKEGTKEVQVFAKVFHKGDLQTEEDNSNLLFSWYTFSRSGEVLYAVTQKEPTITIPVEKIASDGYVSVEVLEEKSLLTATQASFFFVEDGEDGEDGRTSHIWIKYSKSSSGANMSDSPVGALYIGVATTYEDEAPSKPSDYSWSLIKGEEGVPGKTGSDGRTTYVHIKYSNDGKSFTGNNGEDPGDWIGTYTDFNKEDSNDFSAYIWKKIKGDDGDDGLTFYTWVKYADTPTSGMSDNPRDKKYIGLAHNRTTPTPSTNYLDYKWAEFKGKDGIPGTPGLNGKTYYTWVAYADNKNGQGLSFDDEGKAFIGLAFNKEVSKPSTDPTEYSWKLMPQNIEVGGRNFVSHGDKLIVANKTYIQYKVYNHHLENLIGENITVSFEARTLSNEEDIVRVYWRGNGVLYDENVRITNEWKKYSFTRKVTTGVANKPNIAFHTNRTNGGGTVFDGEFRNIKIERGTVATDWSPAPEDLIQQEDLDELDRAVKLVEERTQADKIVDTVIKAKDFESILDQKAAKEDLDGLATGEDLAGKADLLDVQGLATITDLDAVNKSIVEYIDGRTAQNRDKINQLESSLERTAADLVAEFKSQGGNNLILNSIGWADLDFWENKGNVTVHESDLLTGLGFGKGFAKKDSAGIASLEQSLLVVPGQDYAISAWINKQTTKGDVGVEVYDGEKLLFFVGKTDGKETSGYELGTESFFPSSSRIKIRLLFSEGSVGFITGLMLNTGKAAYHWQHHDSEVYNTNIKMNLNGITVKNEQTGGYTVMSPREFSGYAQTFNESGQEQMEKIFTLNGEVTEVKKLHAQEVFKLDTIEIRSDSKGWAFVPSN